MNIIAPLLNRSLSVKYTTAVRKIKLARMLRLPSGSSPIALRSRGPKCFGTDVVTPYQARAWHDYPVVIFNCVTPSWKRLDLSDLADTYLDTETSDQLKNIQSIIEVTRQTIEALNIRFAEFKPPPSMYLAERQELTSRLYEFESEEQELNELSNSTVPEASAATLRKSLLKVHLPNQQTTIVQIRENVALRDALAKAMKVRNLTTEMFAVYMIDSNNQKCQISWDTDISLLDCNEISVEVLDEFSITTSTSHDFVRKIFFFLAFCKSCGKLIFTGYYCRTCNYRFHQQCFGGVSVLCHHKASTRKCFF